MVCDSAICVELFPQDSHRQAGGTADEPQVFEAGAKATLEKDTIRVTLPLSIVFHFGRRAEGEIAFYVRTFHFLERTAIFS